MTPASREKAMGERVARLEAIANSLIREVGELRADLRGSRSSTRYRSAGVNAGLEAPPSFVDRYYRWIVGIMIGIVLVLWWSSIALILLGF